MANLLVGSQPWVATGDAENTSGDVFTITAHGSFSEGDQGKLSLAGPFPPDDIIYADYTYETFAFGASAYTYLWLVVTYYKDDGYGASWDPIHTAGDPPTSGSGALDVGSVDDSTLIEIEIKPGDDFGPYEDSGISEYGALATVVLTGGGGPVDPGGGCFWDGRVMTIEDCVEDDGGGGEDPWVGVFGRADTTSQPNMELLRSMFCSDTLYLECADPSIELRLESIAFKSMSEGLGCGNSPTLTPEWSVIESVPFVRELGVEDEVYWSIDWTYLDVLLPSHGFVYVRVGVYLDSTPIQTIEGVAHASPGF